MIQDKDKHHPTYQCTAQQLESLVQGFISAQGMRNLHSCEGPINVEKCKQVLHQHMLAARSCSLKPIQSNFIYKAHLKQQS